MSKAEFLKNLENRLEILNRSEREDILSEYEQHIEMRMNSGLTEEEAIQDFGDMEELVKEIMEAYNVNPDYGRKKKVWRPVIGAPAFCKKLFLRPRKKRKEELTEENMADDSREWEENQIGIEEAQEEKRKENKESGMQKETRKHIGLAAAWKNRKEKTKKECMDWIGTAGNLWSRLWYICLWCGLLCMKVLVLFTIWPIIIAEIAAVVGFGILIVLMVMGYPVIGLTVITIGCLMSGAAVIWLGKEIIFLKIKKREKNKKETDNFPIEGEVCEA